MTTSDRPLIVPTVGGWVVARGNGSDRIYLDNSRVPGGPAYWSSTPYVYPSKSDAESALIWSCPPSPESVATPLGDGWFVGVGQAIDGQGIDFLVALILAIPRLGGVHGSLYRDAAHIFMGWLLKGIVEDWTRPWWRNMRLWIMVGLGVVEVGCAMAYGLHR